MNFTKMPNDCGQHERRAARGDVQPQHSGKHGNANLKSDPGEKTHEHCAREEIGDESDAQQAGEEEKHGGHQRDEAGKRDVTSVVPSRDRRNASRKNRGGGGIGGDDQKARRSERGETNHGEQQCVEAGNERHPGNLCVTQHLRDVQRGELQAGERVAHNRAATKRPNAAKQS